MSGSLVLSLAATMTLTALIDVVAGVIAIYIEIGASYPASTTTGGRPAATALSPGVSRLAPAATYALPRGHSGTGKPHLVCALGEAGMRERLADSLHGKGRRRQPVATAPPQGTCACGEPALLDRVGHTRRGVDPHGLLDAGERGQGYDVVVAALVVVPVDVDHVGPVERGPVHRGIYGVVGRTLWATIATSQSPPALGAGDARAGAAEAPGVSAAAMAAATA